MARYIDKDKLINELKEDCAALVKERWFDDYVQGYSSAIDDIIAEPESDVQEVKRGKWDEIRDGYGKLEGWIHRGCGRMSMGKDNYCPNCGAKMDGKE